VHNHPVDAIFVDLESIIAQFEANEKKDDHEDSESQCQPDHVDGSIDLMMEQVSPGRL
jgi:hypothetical protein